MNTQELWKLNIELGCDDDKDDTVIYEDEETCLEIKLQGNEDGSMRKGRKKLNDFIRMVKSLFIQTFDKSLK